MDESEKILLTIFLRHDQSQHLEQFQTKLDQRDWWERFPPEGVEIESWKVVMGIGQIVTLRLPPSRLAAVNVELERSAWGVFRTEAYPTYDFVKVRERLARESKARRGGQAGPGSPDGPIDSKAGGGDHPRLPHNGLSLEPRQSRTDGPDPAENRLGDALEDLFGRGVHDLSEVVAGLNELGIPAPDGRPWTTASFGAEMRRLGGADG